MRFINDDDEGKRQATRHCYDQADSVHQCFPDLQSSITRDGRSCKLMSRTFRRGGSGRNPIFQRLAIGGSSGLLLLGKGKYILGALKLGKLATVGSMFVSIGTYSVFFGLPYAQG